MLGNQQHKFWLQLVTNNYLLYNLKLTIMKTFGTIWKVIVTVVMVALDYWWIKSMIVNNEFFTLAEYLFWGFVSTFICVCMWILFYYLGEY